MDKKDLKGMVGIIARMREEDFLWIQKWYQAQCNGDWEHSYGIIIETIDNPGWSITIDLETTELEGKTFKKF